MDNNETRFLYSVNPKKVIKSLCGNSLNPPVGSPKTLRLSIDEVRECLRYGSVYRRFANEGRNERVLASNVERLHNEKFMTEDEYKLFLSGEDQKKDLENDNRGKVVNNEPTLDKKQKESKQPEPEKKDNTPVVPEQTTTPEEKSEVKEDGKTEEAPEKVEEKVEDKKETTEEVVKEAPETTNDGKSEDTSAKAEDKKEDQDKSQKSPFVQQNNNKNYGGKNNKNR